MGDRRWWERLWTFIAWPVWRQNRALTRELRRIEKRATDG